MMSIINSIIKISENWFNNDKDGINNLNVKKRDRSPIRKPKKYDYDSNTLNESSINNSIIKHKSKKMFYIGDYDYFNKNTIYSEKNTNKYANTNTNMNTNTNTNIICNEPKYKNIKNTYNNQIHEENDLSLFDNENNKHNYKYNNIYYEDYEDYEDYDDINTEIEDIYTFVFNKITTKIKRIYSYYC